ncbi:acyl carrier protein [Gelidibacter mesophilus]|uniref:acyl carrier protein n=1 Tax=Gelidibacter mesophilus TaxID=169050 RepID=UPI0003FECBB7|nr:acyl carrier protein [Gelidibacter mesophilus]
MEEKFLELFKETLDIEDRELKMSDRFRDYEEWDSIANLSVVAMIDVEYEVIIENSVFKELQTLQELWDSIQSKK